MKRPLLPALLLASAFAFAFTGLAAWAAYSVPWFTIDSGGGTSSGGSYSVRGTIGQPDATLQPMSGGNYRVTGGFWPDLQVVPTATGGPPLTIERSSATTYVLRWAHPSTGWKLQQSTNLQAWTDLDMSARTQSGATWQLAGTIAPGTPKRFFRLTDAP